MLVSQARSAPAAMEAPRHSDGGRMRSEWGREVESWVVVFKGLSC